MESSTERNEQTVDSSPSFPPVDLYGPPRPYNSRSKKIVGILFLVVLSPLLYESALGFFDMQIVSEVDREPIRYRHIAVSMGLVSEIVQRRNIDERNSMKLKLESANLSKKEAELLRAYLTKSGDTVLSAMDDLELSQWGRRAGRIKRRGTWIHNP